MIGLDTFSEFFSEHSGSYVVIGGAACDHYLAEFGFTYRQTDDIDIILVVEALKPEFVERFWDFIEEGEYEVLQKGEKNRYYCFKNPKKKGFPIRLELLSRTPDIISTAEDARFTPIPTEEELERLSAILMDEEYYDFTIANSSEVNGLFRANVFGLICLKAKAFLNLTAERESGKTVHSERINKHKNDVFRLAVTLSGEDRTELPKEIEQDLKSFLDIMEAGPPDTKQILKEMRAPKVEAETLITQLKQSFNFTTKETD